MERSRTEGFARLQRIRFEYLNERLTKTNKSWWSGPNPDEATMIGGLVMDTCATSA